jgi:xylulokinase
MSENYIISVDIGTSYVKAGIYDSNGSCINTCQKKARQKYVENGALVQDADNFVDLFREVVKTLMQNSLIKKQSVKVLSFTGQMAGALGVDKDLNAVTIWSGTMDNRQDLSMENEQDSDMILRLSGTNTPFMAKKIQWFEADNSRHSRKVYKYIGISSYVIAKISDLDAKDLFLEASYLTWTGLADIEKRVWSKDICDIFGIDIDLLPRIVESTAIVGKLSKVFADECGLIEGTPIAAGAGDKIAGCIGTGVVQPGMMIDECSSVAQMTLCVNEYKPDLENRTLEILPSAIPGIYYSSFYIPGSGLALEWFVNNFAGEEKISAEQSGRDVHVLLDEKSEKVNEGSDNLICIGLLGGSCLPFKPNIRGLWVGHSYMHTKAHFYRALLESYAFENKRCVDIMRGKFITLPFDKIKVIGGGASSDLWNDIKVNVLGIDYESLYRDDFSLLGAAIIGGTAIGMFDNIMDTAKNFAEIKKVYKCDNSKTKKYEKIYSLYSKATEDNMNLFDELNKRRMENDA